MYEKVLLIFKRKREKYNWLWKKKLLSLTKKELKSYQDAGNCYIVEKESYKRSLKVEIIKKLGIIAIIQVNIEAQHIVFVN